MSSYSAYVPPFTTGSILGTGFGTLFSRFGPIVVASALVHLPLLVFFADMMALIGGAVMSLVALNISTGQFLTQLSSAISTTMFWIGIIKAPFFALLIGMAGCYEGLRVEGGAEGVGCQTTKAVVESIFLVIVANALFSIFFSSIGI